MGRLVELLAATIIGFWCFAPSILADETVLSTVLTPTDSKDDKKVLSRQSRSGYYDPRQYYGRQFSERISEYDRPRCGRCLDDRFDDREDPYDRSNRDRYDDDRRISHRPTYGNRLDRNKNDEDDDRRYNSDRRNGSERKNGTNDDANEDRDKKPYDDKDDRKGSRGGGDRDRNRYDDRNRYRPDYYDRFLRDPNRERDPYRDRDPYRERDPYGYEDPYRERRPLYDRPLYDDGYYDAGYRRPPYDERGNGYDDRGYGRGRGPHDRPWDETYRGQAGWDAGGRGYYFASGRPEVAPAPAPAWDGYRGDGYASQYPREYPREYVSQYPRQYVYPREYVSQYPREYDSYPREYARPEATVSGWQSVDRPLYPNREPDYRVGLTYPQSYGSRQEYDGYRPASGWQNVGERRPYRDQSSQLGKHRGGYGQGSNQYGQGSNQYDQGSSQYGQGSNQYGQGSSQYGQGSNQYGQGSSQYGQGSNAGSSQYGQGSNAGSNSYGQSSNSGTNTYSSSTTPATSYLYQREDDKVTIHEESTPKPAS